MHSVLLCMLLVYFLFVRYYLDNAISLLVYAKWGDFLNLHMLLDDHAAPGTSTSDRVR